MLLHKIPSYIPPEGSHSGIVTEAATTTDPKTGQEFIAITALADSIEDEFCDFYVRAIYWESQNRQFFVDARKLLGNDAAKLRGPDGKLNEKALSMFVGVPVQFEVKHKQKPGYLAPYCQVLNLRPDNRKAA